MVSASLMGWLVPCIVVLAHIMMLADNPYYDVRCKPKKLF